MFFKKATKFDEIFTIDLTLCSKCQIDGEDFVNFCGLLRKLELYHYYIMKNTFFFFSLQTLEFHGTLDHNIWHQYSGPLYCLYCNILFGGGGHESLWNIPTLCGLILTRYHSYIT